MSKVQALIGTHNKLDNAKRLLSRIDDPNTLLGIAIYTIFQQDCSIKLSAASHFVTCFYLPIAYASGCIMRPNQQKECRDSMKILWEHLMEFLKTNIALLSLYDGLKKEGGKFAKMKAYTLILPLRAAARLCPQSHTLLFKSSVFGNHEGIKPSSTLKMEVVGLRRALDFLRESSASSVNVSNPQDESLQVVSTIRTSEGDNHTAAAPSTLGQPVAAPTTPEHAHDNNSLAAARWRFTVYWNFMRTVCKTPADKLKTSILAAVAAAHKVGHVAMAAGEKTDDGEGPNITTAAPVRTAKNACAPSVKNLKGINDFIDRCHSSRHHILFVRLLSHKLPIKSAVGDAETPENRMLRKQMAFMRIIIEEKGSDMGQSLLSFFDCKTTVDPSLKQK